MSDPYKDMPRPDALRYLGKRYLRKPECIDLVNGAADELEALKAERDQLREAWLDQQTAITDLKNERYDLREALREIITLTQSVEPGADVQRFHDLYFATGRASLLLRGGEL